MAKAGETRLLLLGGPDVGLDRRRNHAETQNYAEGALRPAFCLIRFWLIGLIFARA
ncbi:hypothetical protein LJC60_02685 [Ruminococcaceae bacterium OttesenSCG-928-D13]|nr:hypothetical protein [Ruminococcaceae bacterium OttesenSCG-928-D13]